ncbi:MAG: hypothetical protein CVV23_00410 [Ignavibacteriae bacterium HGW-Ignavibacteriae-2]|jgi:hypothetical protein|nr:MAG: hypothetical protein CVV23_00410 [Ignavibacteriae bacterium HGW-Ignavibacteriae-2]
MKLKSSYILAAVLTMPILLFAQRDNYYFGAGLGTGNIKSNSPSQTSLSGTIIIGIDNVLGTEIGIRSSYVIARKVNYFLPENSAGKYYPFVQCFSLNAVLNQPLNGRMFTEQLIGIVLLNDRTFSDINKWDYGITFSVLLGWDLRDNNREGFKIGIAGDAALTFTSTNASYYIISFKALYYL